MARKRGIYFMKQKLFNFNYSVTFDTVLCVQELCGSPQILNVYFFETYVYEHRVITIFILKAPEWSCTSTASLSAFIQCVGITLLEI
jgi:hypothetical protein